MQPCYLNILICRFELFRQTVVTGFKPELLTSQVRLRTRWATERTYRPWKPIDMKLDMCDANVQKFQRFQISQHINIVLKS